MITLVFACGHRFTVEATIDGALACPTCGEHRISRTTAPAPRFVGVCQGPSAETRPLSGIPLSIPKKEQ